MATPRRSSTLKKPFKLFIGYDSHEDVAFQVAKYSCLARASVPVDVQPLRLHELRASGVYARDLDPKQSTEFTYLRFLVPYLSGYDGWSMFIDDDFLFQADIAQLIDELDDTKALMCVQHEVESRCTTKLAGVPQQNYPRKNWSSMLLFNGAHPAVQALTPDVVNRETPKFLHRLQWVPRDEDIGAVSYRWNWLVDWYDYAKHERACLVHYTDGGPWFPDYRSRGVDYQQEWLAELRRYERTLDQPRTLCPFERFSAQGDLSRDSSSGSSSGPRLLTQANGDPYPGTQAQWTWEQNEAWQDEQIKKWSK